MRARRTLAFTFAMLLAVGLTGCGPETQPEPPDVPATDIAIVCGNHSNAVPPIVDSDELTEAIEYSVRNCGSVTIVVNDGSPFAPLDFTIKASEVEAMSSSRQEQFFGETVADVQAILADAKAVTPEVDTLEAIREAAKGLTDEANGRCMYILDSGLSTKGDLNVLSGNLMRVVDVTPVVDRLRENHALPDLEGVHVVWIGLGKAAGVQEMPTSQNLYILKELWRAVLEAAGAKVEFISYPTGQVDIDDTTLPDVTPIVIVRNDDFDPVNVNQVQPRFYPDSDELIDKEEAQTQLLPIVNYLLEHPQYSVLLAGTTASDGTNESCKELSLKRAETVRRLLVEMGVPEQQIQRTVGLGYKHEFHVDDLNADGSLNEANAPENRAVLVIGAGTEAAKILENY